MTKIVVVGAGPAGIMASIFLKEKLNDHYFILLAGQVHSCLHTILICEYENNFFAVCDPLYREIQSKSDKEINEFMHTSIGKWCLLVREKSHSSNV